MGKEKDQELPECSNPRSEPNVLWIVVPCNNETMVLPTTAPLFLAQLQDMITKKLISAESRILFINDGSTDDTWQLISSLAQEDSHYIGIDLSRNRGQQNALLAGLMIAKDKADIAITIDCDGQDDITVMNKMVEEYHNGYEVVYGVRDRRDTDTFLKRWTAENFYRFLNAMGAQTIYNHAEYRLMSARVLHELEGFREVNLYLRGLIPLIGFRSTEVYYNRQKRLAGHTHYPLHQAMLLAVEAITSLSTRPLWFISLLGICVAIISFLGIIWAVTRQIMGQTVIGWASMTCIICFVSGVQLICLGVIGEYVGKIYLEVKGRPRYIIAAKTWEADER